MARQIINLGTADKGNGDPIRTAFEKTNSNFAELYAILAGGGGARVIATDIIGSVFGDDSTKIVDGVSGTLHGRLIGDVEGSVFADDSALMVDAVSNRLFASKIYLNGTELSTNKIISGDKEVVLTGGANPYVTFPTIASGENVIIQGAEIASSNGAVAITSSDSVVVNTNALTSLNTWTFGDDGNLTLPSGGDIVDSTGTSVLGSNSTLTFQTVPTWKYGKAGDVAGMVSADSNYFYVCFRNFVDNSTACWHRIPKDSLW